MIKLKNKMKNIFNLIKIFVLITIILLLFNALSACNKGFEETHTPDKISSTPAITISDTHPQYWQYKGENILLLGGSVTDDLFHIPNLKEHLDLLKSVGGNYIRNNMGSDGNTIWAFYYDQEKDGYDLDQWNNEYWNRLENLLKLTAERDIIVQIEIWSTFSFYRDSWDVNPFNPKNNIIYSAERTKLPLEVKTHPTRCENSFFWSIPSQQNNMEVLKYQQKFVDKILSYSLNYGNVLYCMDNETSVTSEWGKFWSEYIKKRAKEEGKIVHTTEMWDPWDLSHVSHRESFDHPEIYSFVEISQNNHQRGQNHWDNGLALIERLKRAGNLRPVTNIKTYGNDLGRHGGGTQNGIQSFIRSVLFGSAAVRFHRPNSGLGLTGQAQYVIKSVRMLSDSMDFFNGEPHNDLLLERENNEAYCRAIPGQEYVVYFTDGGEVELNLQAKKSKVKIKWLNVLQSQWTKQETIDGGRIVSLECPGNGHWFALIQ